MDEKKQAKSDHSLIPNRLTTLIPRSQSMLRRFPNFESMEFGVFSKPLTKIVFCTILEKYKTTGFKTRREIG
jgi:hypothetical protein